MGYTGCMGLGGPPERLSAGPGLGTSSRVADPGCTPESPEHVHPLKF